MGRQLISGRAMRRVLASMVGVAGLALAAGASAPAIAATTDAPAAAPQYNIELCCQLCPKAADPTSYDGSSYLNDFRVLEQGRKGWLFRSKMDLATHIDINDESIAQLHRLVTALRARGSELVIVLQPPRGLMDPDMLTTAERARYDFATAKQSYANALARIRLSGAQVAPLDTLVNEHKGYEYFFRRDHHWTPEGARHTAAVVAQTIKSLPAYRQIPQQQYVTKEASLIGKPGTLQKVAAQICGGSYSMQYVTGYVTELAGGDDAGALLGNDTSSNGDASGGGLLDVANKGNDGGGLLGADGADGGVPQVALIGTSNSDTKGGYNFAGFLEQDLSVDIFDTALSGGSFDGSLLHYLPSKIYQDHPPKVIVWEIPWQNWPGAQEGDKDPYKTYRQAVPLVYDGCDGRQAVMSRTIDVHQGSNELLFNGGHVEPLVGGHYWLDVQFSDPTVKDMHAMIWYYSGQKDSLKLHFNQYVDNGGRFVTELRDDRPEYAKATMMGATLEIDQPVSASLKVTARVCAAEGAGQQTASLQEVRHGHH
ncbi:alginate O-acetyltransferase AlgX-related protein [Solimonas marina]|uniref:Alginate biosynthesis protein AlgX n=1 Tax=Solimonas marina TaxID=2714601 RepID=A0A969WA93_9GAMM|nr:alginate biosynthesis protein AlgX [Solimonas marina]NKF22429.1 hypothetical protein [Solimonas marina]